MGRESTRRWFLSINFANAGDNVFETFKGDLSTERVIDCLSAIYLEFDFVPRKMLIFLDEIQMCLNARTALMSLVKNGSYIAIASGFLLGIRIKEVRLNPTKYLERVKMHPIDFEEFFLAIGMPYKVMDSVCGNISYMNPIDDTFFRMFTNVQQIHGDGQHARSHRGIFGIQDVHGTSPDLQRTVLGIHG